MILKTLFEDGREWAIFEYDQDSNTSIWTSQILHHVDIVMPEADPPMTSRDELSIMRIHST